MKPVTEKIGLLARTEQLPDLSEEVIPKAGRRMMGCPRNQEQMLEQYRDTYSLMM
jgi:hypothetical protein